MLFPRTAPALAAISMLLAYLGGCASSRVTNEQYGVSVVVPDGWRMQSRSEIEEAHKDYNLPSGRPEPDTESVVFKIAKYEEPTEKLNPSVHIVRLPLDEWKGQDAKAVLEASLPFAFADDAWIEKPQNIEIKNENGAKGVYIKHLETYDGVEYTFHVQSWGILRETDFIGIQMSGPVKGPDNSRKEFAEILESLRIMTD